MLIKINGEEIDVADASTIQDVIDETNAPYTPGSIVCLIRGKKELEKNIDKYKIKTNKGSIIIQLDESEDAKPLVDVWKNQYEDFIDLNIRWSTSTEIAIGPIVTDLEPTSDEFKYYEGDVVLSLSSFSNESTHLIMLKENTTNVYSVPPYNKGIFAHIIGGKKTLDILTDDDSVIGIEPIIERSTTTDSASVSDLSTVLEEGNELFTYISFDVDESSPVCVEHLFSLIKDGRIKVSYDSESFIGFYELSGLEKPKENTTQRTRGTITVRNTGVGTGKLFIYRENRVLTPNHTTVGKIVKGMEIIDIAKENDFITVKSEQQRLMLLNKTQKEATELLSSAGVEHMIDGLIDDDAIIVEQLPKHTIDILKNGKVVTKAVKKEDLCVIKFTENAPRSVRYFKLLSGLLENPVGQIKVHFSVPGMHIVIFEGDKKSAKGLVPENNPVDKVVRGQIGITNMASKSVGLIGIRFEDNSEFGPTAESFEATNIIGDVVSDYESIENLKEGVVVYVTESNHES
ncbi:MAG: methanogenesis marker 3 protein [Methanobrevibacter sp.]|uniref:methyl-coenzyme M reductase-associated protein Mmp3 n=1 Tax=uncultured Methanobrevibacter sp. TaxID=253161 RepID=UPI00260071A0|nr:methanogenesis marker 3 protein [uncultured Methanobrevibacter sp.]MEE1128625.1 methanogenesis marker 3 protein [Methanobrevibacter sp.]